MSKHGQGRLADEVLQATDARRAKERERIFAAALRAVAGTAPGRAVLHEVIYGHGWCGLKNASYSGRGDETCLREGHRDIGRLLDATLLGTCPQLWSQMMAEGQAATAREQDARKGAQIDHEQEQETADA